MSPTLGRWDILPFQSPLLPVHAALLPPVGGAISSIIFLSGSRTEGGGGCPDCSVVWEYSKGNSFFRPPTPKIFSAESNTQVPYDFFCCGHVHLANGSLLIAGGTTNDSPPFKGIPNAAVFNPASRKWYLADEMADGRWYPTLVRVGPERVFAVSGKDKNGRINQLPELYESGKDWAWAEYAGSAYIPNNYPDLFLLPDGKLFTAGRANGGKACKITIPPSTSQPIASQVLSVLAEPNKAQSVCVVLLPPAQDQKFMAIGGFDTSEGIATKRVNIIDLKAATPRYVAAPSMKYARLHHQAVILPDRTILVCGGSYRRQIPDTARKTAELYNPQTNTWQDMATSTIGRLYHSVALLLPNGKVLMAGSNPPPGQFEYRLEYYSPTYLFKGPRPVITQAPIEISYGQTITLRTPQSGSIKWAQLMRPSTVTHSLDVDQRLIDLKFVSAAGALQIDVESNPNLAPAGWYMLFIVDNNDLPSDATWVHLT